MAKRRRHDRQTRRKEESVTRGLVRSEVRPGKETLEQRD